MLSGPAVEVRKNANTYTWYNASIVDIDGDKLTVVFEDGVWPKRDAPSHLVRPCPNAGAMDSFDPGIDELVEVFVSATDSNPSGWAQGKVKSIKDSFYFIGFVGEKENLRGGRDVIVEQSSLRRVSAERHIDVSGLTRRCLKVDKALRSWVVSKDSAGCLSHVQKTAKLMVATVAPEVNPPEVLLVGSEHSVELAVKLLLQFHFKFQLDMQKWHTNREYFTERLKEAQSWQSAQHSETFSVDLSLVGKIIGKKGENINLVRENHGVEVELWDGDDSQCKMVTVSAETAEQVQAAREELEYKVVRIPINESEVGWTLGKGYQTLTDIAKKAELHYARFDDKSSSVELCGLQHQVENAKMLITVHREYLAVYKDMDQEKEKIQTSFEELDGAQKGKGGKKGGKGGWKGAKGADVEEDVEEASGYKGGGKRKGRGKKGDR